MTYRVIHFPAALDHIYEAAQWYNQQSPSIADHF
jgi:hypothetical protein